MLPNRQCVLKLGQLYAASPNNLAGPRPLFQAYPRTSTTLQRRNRRLALVRSSQRQEEEPVALSEGTASRPASELLGSKQEGPSADLSVIFDRLQTLLWPYWTESDEKVQARWKLAGVFALTLATTGVSVLFNFLGRDFFNALSAKDQEKFTEMLFKWLGGIVLGVPVFVLRDYYQSKLSLEWREWMTKKLTADYFQDRTFYQVQAGALVDNPDQRLAVDVREFTDTSVAFSVTMLNAFIDLISFSGILYSIYPPLFVAIIVYAVGGTGLSIYIGKPLVRLNFQQEAQEANFRYGLVRVRENAESIAFYGGEDNEQRFLSRRLRAAIDNFGQLLIASRNLNFFTSFYRFLISVLPAAVIAPLFFRGEIEFGVITQSSSAFNHILGDVSLVVYRFEALAGFSAVIDRLGEFSEVLGASKNGALAATAAAGAAGAAGAATASKSAPAGEGTPAAGETPLVADLPLEDTPAALVSDSGSRGGVLLVDVQGSASGPLLEVQNLSLVVPSTQAVLCSGLNLTITPGRSLLIMGPSGAGKTTILRTVAGLWSHGSGSVVRHGEPMGRREGQGEIFFVPQRPYVVLGTLRDQLLYPTWAHPQPGEGNGNGNGSGSEAVDGGGTPSPGLVTKVVDYVVKGGSSNGSSTNGSSGSTNGMAISPAGPPLPSSSPPPAQPTAPPSDPAATPTPAAGPPVQTPGSPARPLPTDAELREAMRAVQLGPLLDRIEGKLDTVADWASILSLGEQQRLAFARVLLSKPRLLLMDESTSALDTRNERILYQALRSAGITLVSVGHRPTLLGFHEEVLLLEGGGSWELKQAAELSLQTAVDMMG